MCCFTGVVESVSATNIFARPALDENQFLVYSMSVELKDELAMVLPLPVPKESAENSVKFINLEKYADFFVDMAKGFPTPKGRGAAGGLRAAAVAPEPQLAVVEVGSFEASFVPAVKDFARLDKRFRLPDGVWDKLPTYKDYGFAVFKLKSGRQTVHPMAFRFARANRRRIFFPTVHIHDGEVHDTAEFDHSLYFQLAAADYSPKNGWVESARPAGMFLDERKAQGLIERDLHCYRRTITGEQKNADTFV